MSRVLEHPNCDVGTALLIFWLAGPVFVFRRAAKGKLTERQEKERYQFLKNIQDRIESKGFRSSIIAVDPTDILGTGAIVARQYISETMFLISPGEPVARRSLK